MFVMKKGSVGWQNYRRLRQRVPTSPPMARGSNQPWSCTGTESVGRLSPAPIPSRAISGRTFCSAGRSSRKETCGWWATSSEERWRLTLRDSKEFERVEVESARAKSNAPSEEVKKERDSNPLGRQFGRPLLERLRSGAPPVISVDIQRTNPR